MHLKIEQYLNNIQVSWVFFDFIQTYFHVNNISLGENIININIHTYIVRNTCYSFTIEISLVQRLRIK